MKTGFLVLLLAFFNVQGLYAVKIIGKVVNLSTDKPLMEVEISNVHSGMTVVTPKDGTFEMEVKTGDLIEFRLADFQVARVKIKSENVANFYYIQMQVAPTNIENQLIQDYVMGAKIDSIKRRELYQKALDHYKLTGLDIVQHPFDAMSKRNRMIWRFQKNYEIWEKDKFIDYVFNDRLIVQLTGLNAENIEEYKRRFRPSYDQIRGLNEYDYYSYIKETVKLFNQDLENQKNKKTNPEENYNYDRE
ncbi:MAG TPA: hypothetical protein VLZ83_10105 [Edaphocola sp.]|nr:hypothetical protein [Edaphocola sp.]